MPKQANSHVETTSEPRALPDSPLMEAAAAASRAADGAGGAKVPGLTRACSLESESETFRLEIAHVRSSQSVRSLVRGSELIHLKANG